jgi:hypothetical protein
MTRPFVAGRDTTFLGSWWSDTQWCEVEVRASASSPDPTVSFYRGVYFAHGCSATENAPLLEFRPHENTIENIHIELYAKHAIFGTLSRGLSKSWFYYQNGVTQADTLDVRGQVSLYWPAVAYPVASRRISPSSATMYAGTPLRLVAQAFSANGVEIYNQPTSSWSSTNPDATLSSATGTQTVSAYGAPWYNWTSDLSSVIPGTTTVNVAFGGQSLSVPVTIVPPATLSGGGLIRRRGLNTFTVNASYCGSGCTMHWVQQFAVSGLTVDKGTFYGTSSSVNIAWTGNGDSELRVDVSVNGVTNTLSKLLGEEP